MANYEHLSGKFVKVSSPEPHILLVELARYVAIMLALYNGWLTVTLKKTGERIL